jgi:hypothetical protein
MYVQSLFKTGRCNALQRVESSIESTRVVAADAAWSPLRESTTHTNEWFVTLPTMQQDKSSTDIQLVVVTEAT